VYVIPCKPLNTSVVRRPYKTDDKKLAISLTNTETRLGKSYLIHKTRTQCVISGEPGNFIARLFRCSSPNRSMSWVINFHDPLFPKGRISTTCFDYFCIFYSRDYIISIHDYNNLNTFYLRRSRCNFYFLID